MGLYTFSKSAWHVKLFTWLFNEDPTRRYKTMCPYFWTYVLIVLFFPLILIVKMFGSAGTKFLSWVKDYKRNKEEAAEKSLIKKCSKEGLTQAEAYMIVKSKCFKKYSWRLDYNLYSKLKTLYNIELNNRFDLREIAKNERLERIDAMQKRMDGFKEYKAYTYASYLILGSLSLSILYAIYFMVSMIPFASINWAFVWEITYSLILVLDVLGGGIFLIYTLFKYILIPFFTWLSCVRLPNCGICTGVRKYGKYLLYIFYPFYWLGLGIIKMFAIIGHMIYSTYKKSCPMITWEDK